jgi:RNA polymerase sigma-70 factor (ECF subfamily)
MEWVELYADYLYRYAIVRVADTVVAEELVQETFIAALLAVRENRFHGKSSEKTWMTGILKHKLIDFFRTKYRHRTLSLDMIDESQMEESFDARGNWQVKPGKWGENPRNRYEQKEMARILMNCLETLQGKQADAIRLREISGEETEDICKVLNISTTNYWVLMHRARLALRKCMERNWLQDA